MKKVSVVIINYNGFKYLKALIPTVEKQSYHVDEIIIVDDCSTDESIENIKKDFPKTIVKKNESNLGPGVARDLGRKISKNKKIIFLDNDTELDENVVRFLIEASENYPNYVFFVPRVLYYKDKNIIQKEGSSMHYLGISINEENSNRRKEEVICDFKEIKAFSGVCYLMDLEKTTYIENHDGSFFYTFEDLDFAVRNFLRGNKALLVPKAEVYHKDGTKGLSYRVGYEYPSKRLFFLIRNRWYFIIKNYSLKSILLISPISILIEIFLFVFSIIRSRDKLVYFKSHISLLKNIKIVMRERINPVDVNKFVYNEELRLNEATFGGPVMKVGFYLINKLLLFYGNHVLKLKASK